MVSIRIDGQTVEVPDGATVLEAARSIGVEIPTLCHMKGHDPLTSCMVCLVRVKGVARFVPSCATKVTPGMEIESETEEVRRARRTAMELLLSDHAGDCLAPCQLVCPAHMHIDEMLRLIAARRWRRALEVVKEEIPFPSTLGRICPDLCEKGCRRASHDSPVSICSLKKFVGDRDLQSGAPYIPEKAPPTGKRVAIVGGGPAGLTAAYYLLIDGHDVTIYDARPRLGGNLRYAIEPTVLPPDILEAEIAIIEKLGLRFVPRTPLVNVQHESSTITLSELRDTFDAVVIALGVIDSALPKSLGLTMAGKGIAVDPHSGMTSVAGVFACGASINPHRLAVRAVGDGHHVAKAVNTYLEGVPLAGREESFSVRLHVLSPVEMQVMLTGSADAPRESAKMLTEDQAAAEAARCLHCGCAGAHDCALRLHSAAYHADPRHFRGERRAIALCDAGDNVIFEPGKCISCGKCVAITAQAGDSSQAYHGRGFDMRISPTFDATFSEAVSKVAQQVVDACPTAAIRWRTKD